MVESVGELGMTGVLMEMILKLVQLRLGLAGHKLVLKCIMDTVPRSYRISFVVFSFTMMKQSSFVYDLMLAINVSTSWN